MVWEVVGASREDVRIARMGAQVINHNNNNNKKKKNRNKKDDDDDDDDDGCRILHDLYTLASIHLSGEALEELTNRFIETLCEDIDRRFPPRKNDQNHDDGGWETIDLPSYIKSTWTHASITALFGSHIHSLWPDIGTWLWDFDAHFQKIVARMPRFLFPGAYALRDEGQRMCMLWEEEALRAEREGEISSSSSYKNIEGDDGNGNGALWDPYWGHRYTRLRAKRMMENGISARGRAGNAISLLWGLST